eukprot:2547615-Rhodomonas_salina.2
MAGRGGQVRHYTVPNSSGSTRVSLDFRVVPRSAFLPAERFLACPRLPHARARASRLPLLASHAC